MGRYYSTQNFYGKFGFATQDSTDPEIFGMYEDNVIHYYLDADEETLKNCKNVIDKQFDILNVPKKLREYEKNSDEEVYQYTSTLFDYVFKPRENEEGMGYYIDEERSNMVEVDAGYNLALCRIQLGMMIYSELLHEGYCRLEAEC